MSFIVTATFLLLARKKNEIHIFFLKATHRWRQSVAPAGNTNFPQKSPMNNKKKLGI